ncbi:MAG: hypothetical protein OEZ36_10595 [Spirochaetota bacterium]|nr:hypothetical protein [Spirochaetota bacterium]
MNKKILSKWIFLIFGVLSLSGFSCLDSKAEGEVIHLSIRSTPPGAEIYWRIVSTTEEVKSSNRFFLGMTPYRGTRSISLPGLTRENAHEVTFVLEVEKKGYAIMVERYNLASLLNDLEISAKFNLMAEK